MHIEQILEVLKQPNISHYLTEMSQVHMYTKHYLLIAEELSEEGVAFLQPLKEHRDAYDHISRIFSLSLKDGNNEERDDEAYILDNVRKAFGHEYRAFFDMADWFTYICRKYIREELSSKIKKKKYQEKLRADGKVSKKQEIEKRRKKIKALLEQDFKRKDICSQLDISIKTYKRDISFLKEQGLI